MVVTSCNKNEEIVEKTETQKTKIDSVNSDELIFSFITNFSHPNISNTSDRRIDLLFNGVNNYLGGKRNPDIDFHTECLECEPMQKVLGGKELLFAKRLLITPKQIKYYKNILPINDTVNCIKFQTDGRNRTNRKFQFNEGNGIIEYIGISCDDADFNKIRLTFSKGEIVIDSLINASFFEYDLNNNGSKEQYLFGTRTCNQEFVLLRIRKISDL